MFKLLKATDGRKITNERRPRIMVPAIRRRFFEDCEKDCCITTRVSPPSLLLEGQTRQLRLYLGKQSGTFSFGTLNVSVVHNIVIYKCFTVIVVGE